jgi:hypothetical protein
MREPKFPQGPDIVGHKKKVFLLYCPTTDIVPGGNATPTRVEVLIGHPFERITRCLDLVPSLSEAFHLRG